MSNMTPTRAKRNSKAPERFSSDDIKTDTNQSSNHEQGDKSAIKIKLKPLIREPLKVKLPKLKRLEVEQTRKRTKDSVKVGRIGSGTLSKIKLPIRRSPNVNFERNGLSSQTDLLGSNRDLNGSDIQNSEELKPISPQSDTRISPRESKTNTSLDRFFDNLGSGDNEIEPDLDSSDPEEPDAKIILDRKQESITNSSGIRCPCGVDDDLGVMVECEKCSTWQHGHCINVGLEEDAYEGYVCAYCTLPSGRHNDSLQQLTVGDRFHLKFEILESSLKHRHGAPSDFDGRDDENQANFTPDELEVAIADLKRVSNSLKVKWKLLTNEDYNAELKIWRNPIWSEDPEENRKQQQHQSVRFIGDVYKSNLKLNICNMLNKMHTRCQLMRYQISKLETEGQHSESRIDKLLCSLDEISQIVEQLSDNSKTI